MKSQSNPSNSLIASLDVLEAWCRNSGLPSFRASQVRRWVFDSRISSIDEMSNLPVSLREQLASEFSFWSTSIARHQQSEDGTEKLLLQLNDGNRIECVLLRDGSRRTICVSSQVGCAMGCVFCASGLDGVARNLESHEIVEQMIQLQRLLPAEERLSHIVMMGMGEPLANLENVLAALEIATSPDGLGISPRRVTISTVGIPPAIERLARLECRFNLAVSLHAPNDELRDQLVPVNKKIGVKAIMSAADLYFQISGRRLTFEYVLLAGINDQPEHAEALVRLLAGKIALLNVIPYNPVPGLPYKTPGNTTIRQFREILETGGIQVKFRHRKGDKISAACGQLRRVQLPSVTTTASG